jgi:hypothetical protein
MNQNFFNLVIKIVREITFSKALDLLDSLNVDYINLEVYRGYADCILLKFKDLASSPGTRSQPLRALGCIWFYGGPPGHEGWFCVPTFQYVADCLFKEAILNGSYYITLKLRPYYNAKV